MESTQGLFPDEEDEEDEGCEESGTHQTPVSSRVDHLVLVVHGVGSHAKRLPRVLAKLRKRSAEVVRDKMQAFAVDFLGVEWHEDLHEGTDEELERLHVHEGTVACLLRRLTGAVIMDVLYYMGPRRGEVVAEVVRKLNNAYSGYCDTHPNFSGRVSFIAHSLGSLICYDLMCNQRGGAREMSHNGTQGPGRARSMDPNPHLVVPELTFWPENLFLLGSPLGMFWFVRGNTVNVPPLFPLCRIFNIFHPYDPIAYRIEPFIHKTFEGILPALVPHHKTTSGFRRHRLLKDKFRTFFRRRSPSSQQEVSSRSSTSSWDDSAGQTTEPLATSSRLLLTGHVSERPPVVSFAPIDAPPTDVSPKELANGIRWDFQLQPSAVQAAGEAVWSLKSHRAYWGDRDVALFIMRQLSDPGKTSYHLVDLSPVKG